MQYCSLLRMLILIEYPISEVKKCEINNTCNFHYATALSLYK